MGNSVLDRVLDTVSCTDEEDLNKLYQILNPTEREEMGKLYDETLGYNPINYFDYAEAERYFAVLTMDAPKDVKKTLEQMKDEILESVITHKENLNTDYLITLLNLEMEHLTGWRNKKYSLLRIEEEFIDSPEELEDEFDDAEDDDDDYEDEGDVDDDE